MNVEVNFLAVLLAAVAAMGVGFLWYGPMLFAKTWMKEKGYTQASLEKMKGSMGMTYGISFVLALVTGYVLAHVMGLSMNFFHYSPVQTGLTSAFWMWLGFVFPVQCTATLFGDKNWKLFQLDTGHQLVALLVMGLVIGWLS